MNFHCSLFIQILFPPILMYCMYNSYILQNDTATVVIKRNVVAASTLFRQICYWNIVCELTVRREVRRNGVIKIWDWGWGQVTNLSNTLHYMEQHTWECISKHSDVPSIAFQSISHVMEANRRISLTCMLHHTVF